MPRDRAKVHRLLQEAATVLFEENGYDQTTAAQVAARAGVTERTYFRHFADKRDILFEGSERLEASLVQSIAAAPPGLGLMAVLRHALGEVASTLEHADLFSASRQAVISATPTLQEREATKHAALMKAMAAGLERRGFEKKRAEFASRIGGAVFGYALATWFENTAMELVCCLDLSFEQLRILDA